jgi:D-alanine-D-alanine ligase
MTQSRRLQFRLADLPPVPSPGSLGRVAVIYGGWSSEREVSIRSGSAVLRALCESGVDAHAFDPASDRLAQLENGGFDRAFLILHGRFGEDGAIQGVLETLQIPYTGSGIQASAIAIDKTATKRLWTAAGIPTPGGLTLRRGAPLPANLAALGERLIVKPAREGSTVGVTKVNGANRAELMRALEDAWRFDADVLVEECIIGRELTCAVIGTDDQARYLPIVEIRAPGANYDYHNKYLGNDTQYLCPAPLSEAASRRIGELCVDAYRQVGARGWGRIDIMLRGEGEAAQPCLLEINTAPGMTDHSLVPMAAREAGLDFTQLVVRLLADASLELKR